MDEIIKSNISDRYDRTKSKYVFASFHYTLKCVRRKDNVRVGYLGGKELSKCL